MGENKADNKYQRREFLKTTGKGVIGAGIGGLMGYVTGKAYKAGRDSYRENVKPYVEKGKKIIDKTEERKEDIKDWWNKNFNKEEYKNHQQEELEESKQPEKMSRRGFISKYFHLFNEHPVSTGTATGTSIGSLVATLKLFPKYIEKNKIAKLKDEHIEYKEKVKILEAYKNSLESELENKRYKKKYSEKELQKQIDEEIEEELGKVNSISSGLEKKVEDENLETPISMIVSGLFLTFVLALSKGFSYTGFSVLSKENPSINIFIIVNLIISLILITIGLIKINRLKK